MKKLKMFLGFLDITFRKGNVSFLPQAVVTLGEVPAFKPLTPGLFDGPPRLVQALQAGSVSELLIALFNIAISIGAILAVLRIGYAGFKYITSDVAGVKNDAKEIITNAVIGLLLLLAVVLILEKINPDILKIKIELQPVAGQSGASTGGASPFGTAP